MSAMSPLDYIKSGVLEGNWETVCEGYERLTGDALPIPKTTTDTVEIEDALKQIVDIIGRVQTVSTKTAKKPETKPAKKKAGRPKGSGKKKVKKTNTVSKDGEDSSLQLDDKDKTMVSRETGGVRLITNNPDPSEVEKNRIKAQSTSRGQVKRQTSKTYKVECNECDEVFQSLRRGGDLGQKCPKCLKNLRGRHS